METQDTLPHIYRELADSYDRRAEPSMRDRFLVLAMDAELRAGHAAEAEKLRQRLLQVSPHHMLKPFASFAEATQAADVQTYLRDLRMNYPSEVAQMLLRSLRSNPQHPSPEVASDPNATLDPHKTYPLQDSRPNGKGPAAAQRTAPMPYRVELDPPPPPAKADKRTEASAEPWRSPRSEREAEPAGGWFGVVLFVVLFFAGIAVAGYVAVRPFMPEVVNAVKVEK